MTVEIGDRIYSVDNPPKNFIAGLDTRKNCSLPNEGEHLVHYGQYDNYIKINNPTDLVIVDRDYLIKNIDEILIWCKNKKELGVIQDCWV